MAIEKFTEPSKVHEALFVGYLWANPQTYQKYRVHKIAQETFASPLWYFYYYVGKEMYDNGVRDFDDKTVYSFLISKPKEKNKKSYFDCYNDFGGFEVIQEVKDECSRDSNNDEFHFSEIQKYETLRKMQNESLVDVSNQELVDKLCRMSLIQLKMYVQHKFGSMFSHVNHGEIVEYNLLDKDLIDRAIEKMNRGETMGLKLHDSKSLNRKIKGWKKGALTYLVLSSGVGKTSFSAEKFLLSLIENNQKGLMFANEENVEKFIQLMLATVASQILEKPINREKMTEGNFDQRTFDRLNEARDWMVKNRPDSIKFFEIRKYRMEDILSRIEMYRPLGYDHVFIDTFKPDTSKKEVARWEAFSNNAQELHDTIKESTNNCATLATVQLKLGKEYRYLDLSTIGKSGEIVEVAAVVLAGRLLFSDEYPDGKYALKTYIYKKEKLTGEWYKEEYTLNKDKRYMILFICKNRFGGIDEQIIYEANYGINEWKEVCLCSMPKIANAG